MLGRYYWEFDFERCCVGGEEEGELRRPCYGMPTTLWLRSTLPLRGDDRLRSCD